MTNYNHPSIELSTETQRQVGDQILSVIQLAPESPANVMDRDNVLPEHIGNRPMTRIPTRLSPKLGDEFFSRIAPRLLVENYSATPYFK